MGLAVRGALWAIGYLLVALSPLAFALAGPGRPGRGFWIDFSVALGFVGLAVMGLQFAVTARFKSAMAPFGIDLVLRFHRQITMVAVALIVAHPLILFVVNPLYLRRLHPSSPHPAAVLGALSLLALLVLTALSVWRKRLGLGYELWRTTHWMLGVAAVGLAAAHVVQVGYYVSLPWKQALWLTMAGGTVWLLVYMRVVRPLRARGRPYRVAEVRPERGGAVTLALAAEGHPGLRFLPGQFVWLSIRGTPGHPTPVGAEPHPFSLSSSALAPGRPELTVKALGDYTTALAEVPPGAYAVLDGPYGAFTSERHEGAGFVFVAGGVGVTPLMSMARTLADYEDRRPVLFIYANKRWEDVTYREELERLARRIDLRVVHVLEEPPDGWTGERGFVTAEVLERHLPPHLGRYQYFVCGPDPMMDAVVAALVAHQVPAERIHTERYNLV